MKLSLLLITLLHNYIRQQYATDCFQTGIVTVTTNAINSLQTFEVLHSRITELIGAVYIEAGSCDSIVSLVIMLQAGQYRPKILARARNFSLP
jgi:hypothetical protein